MSTPHAKEATSSRGCFAKLQFSDHLLLSMLLSENDVAVIVFSFPSLFAGNQAHTRSIAPRLRFDSVRVPLERSDLERVRELLDIPIQLGGRCHSLIPSDNQLTIRPTPRHIRPV